MPTLKIDYQDRAWALDLDDIGVDDAIRIQEHTGLSFAAWGIAVSDPSSMDFVKALSAAHWVMLGQNGEPQPPMGSYHLPVGKFAEPYCKALVAAYPPDKKAEAEPDPTGAALNGQAPGSAPSRAPRSRRTRTPMSSPAAPPAGG